jgi:YVTN family beta-propeller protein
MTSAFDMQRSNLCFSASRIGRLAVPLLLAFLGINCGETYRPIAQPIPGPSPTPAPVGHILALAGNGSLLSNPFLNPGSMGRIDVAGDSMVAVVTTGLGPVHAFLTPDGSRLYAANSGEDTVSASPTASNPQGTTIDLIQLCDSAGCPLVVPVFVQTTESTRMYVADAGNGTISVIDTTSNVVIKTFAVDPAFMGQSLPLPDRNSHPVALAELPNSTKIYSLNQGTNSVSSINTLDGSIAKVIPLGSAPVWAAASTDNTHVYVLDNGGTVSVIDTLTDSVVSSVPAAASGLFENYLFYDKTFNRIYVTDANAASPSIALFDIGANGALVAHNPARTTITAVPGTACGGSPIPASITVIGDGSRAYVASYQTGNSQICTQATVIDTGTGLVTKTIPLSQSLDNSSQTNCDVARFRVFATSSFGGTNSLFKVYVSQCDAGTVAVIDTFSASSGSTPHPADWLEAWVASAVSSFPPSQIAVTAATQTAGSSSTSATTTFTYTIVSGPAVQVGMTVYVTGMSDGGNNGAFLVTSANPAAFAFTVANASGTTATGQSGNGSVLPPQNPVFLIAGP